jgi:hypothetical protein
MVRAVAQDQDLLDSRTSALFATASKILITGIRIPDVIAPKRWCGVLLAMIAKSAPLASRRRKASRWYASNFSHDSSSPIVPM